MRLPLPKSTVEHYSECVLGDSESAVGIADEMADDAVFVDNQANPTCRVKDERWIVPGQSKKWIWTAERPESDELYTQAKLLMCHLLFHPDRPTLEVSTLCTYHYGLRAIARSCHRLGLKNVGNLFSDDRAAARIVDDILDNPGNNAFLHAAPSLFNAFHRFGEPVLGFRTIHGDTYARLSGELRRLNKRSFQHPVIPWRIYKKLLVSISDRIDENLLWLDDPAWACAIDFHVSENGPEVRKHPSITVKYLKREFPEFHQRIPTMQKLIGSLGCMQELARIGIIAFTGCRSGEVSDLFCGEPDNVDENTYLLHGASKKAKIGKAYWVTNEVGFKAMQLALKVRETVIHGLTLETDNSTIPLLPSLNQFPNNVTASRTYGASRSKHTKKGRNKMNAILVRNGCPLPNIRQEDYNFLCDLSKDCRVDLSKFTIGTEFPFTAHQLRRSLAYFLVRAGRVELGALKRQLKHLSCAMTTYYTSGVVSTEIEPDMSMPDSLAKEKLLEIDERLRCHLTNFAELAGAMGSSIRRNIEFVDSDKRDSVIEATRERMLRRANQGEIAYVETPLGACLSTDPCIPRARAEVSACLSCKNAILERPKVERTYNVLKASEHPFLATQAEHFSHYLVGPVVSPEDSKNSSSTD